LRRGLRLTRPPVSDRDTARQGWYGTLLERFSRSVVEGNPATPAATPASLAVSWSQMWSHSPGFAGVRRDPSVTVHPGRGRSWTSVNAGHHCWKACWGQPLASSNLASSAILTCGFRPSSITRDRRSGRGFVVGHGRRFRSRPVCRSGPDPAQARHHRLACEVTRASRAAISLPVCSSLMRRSADRGQ
jgi:hypothetical protein